MGTLVEDDGEVFEIEDFSAVSPFERFVSIIEEQLRAWNVAIAAQPEHKHEAAVTAPVPPQPSHVAAVTPGQPLHQALLSMSGRHFQLSVYHTAPPVSATNSQRAAPSGSSLAAASLPLRLDHVTAASRHLHPITVWFGVTSFVLLMPAAAPGEQQQPQTTSKGNTGSSLVVASNRRVSKNEASMLLSALSLACNNAACVLAAFVSVDEGSKQLFSGRTCYGSVVRFDSRVLLSEELPHALRKLSGLTAHFNAGRDRLEGRLAAGQAHTGNRRTLISASLTFQQQTKRWGYHDIGALRSSLPEEDSDGDVFGSTGSGSGGGGDGSDGECRWRDVSEDALIGFGLPWGPSLDPLLALQLRASWPFFPEGTFVSNEVNSGHEAGVRWTCDLLRLTLCAPFWLLLAGVLRSACSRCS